MTGGQQRVMTVLRAIARWRTRHAAKTARRESSLVARTTKASGKAGRKAGRLSARLPVS